MVQTWPRALSHAEPGEARRTSVLAVWPIGLPATVGMVHAHPAQEGSRRPRGYWALEM